MVGIIDTLLFVLMALIPIIQILKRKHCGDACRVTLCAEWFLEKFIKTLTVLFFFCIQETMLSLVVALEFE